MNAFRPSLAFSHLVRHTCHTITVILTILVKMCNAQPFRTALQCLKDEITVLHTSLSSEIIIFIIIIITVIMTALTLSIEMQ